MTTPADAFARILVASDLSPRADFALGRAIRIARSHSAELIAKCVVVEDPDVDVLPESWAQGVLGGSEIREARLRRVEAELRGRLHALNAANTALDLSVGAPFVEIIRAAREREAELIVLGAHGGHFVSPWILGTTAERVVRKGDRPVLVVKKAAKGPYRRVLATIDFSETSRRALQTAVRLAPDARLTLLHVYDFETEPFHAGAGPTAALAELQRQVERQRRDQLLEVAQSSGLDPKNIELNVRFGYPGMVISALAKELRADLVAVGTRGLSVIDYLLLGSVAERVLRESRCDVLAVPPRVIKFALP